MNAYCDTSFEKPLVVMTNNGNFHQLGSESRSEKIRLTLIKTPFQCADGLPRAFSKVVIIIRDAIKVYATLYINKLG